MRADNTTTTGGPSSRSTSGRSAEPTIVETEPETSRWIEIVDLDTGGRVVTAIEVFSPSNKSRESGAAQSSSITR